MMNIKQIFVTVALTAAVGIPVLPLPAIASDGTLYEVSEAVNPRLRSKAFTSSDALLIGKVSIGTPLCPARLAAQLSTDSCWVMVQAQGGASDSTGVGPAGGKIFVLAEFRNPADAPELEVITGEFDGVLDLTQALLHEVPLGGISGTYTVKGEPKSVVDGYRSTGTFRGIFRLPFMNGSQASYLLDDGRIVPVEFQGYAAGEPTPRLEITFTPAGAKK